ncbi:NUDIX domain-containing protein [Aliirhizobium smilacinae]|uniref:NUDIX domain-containing protein n=1 Tax=Aliirhizobium smilacinae TaxID=1395944 RepID=UPI0015D608CF|nr:NUDIX domain-containing protein [Rhizobium smilacinae]
MSEAIVSSRLISRAWGSLTEYELSYRRPDGDIGKMSREVYDRGHAAAVLLCHIDRPTVVLVRQFRPPPLINGDNPYLLEACAGVLEGDTPEECIRREAIEEAGIVVRDLRKIVSAYCNPAALTEVVTLFIGTFDDESRTAGGGLAHEGEDIEVVELPFETAFSMIGTGEIVDMKTIILLQALHIELLTGGAKL